MRFVISLAIADRDAALLDALKSALGAGSIHRKRGGKPHHLPQVRLAVSGRRSRRRATIPFMDRYLFPCAKRTQYERWRDALLQHERDHPSRFGKGPSPCSVDGCDLPVRGRGLRRSHNYRATGY